MPAKSSSVATATLTSATHCHFALPLLRLSSSASASVCSSSSCASLFRARARLAGEVFAHAPSYAARAAATAASTSSAPPFATVASSPPWAGSKVGKVAPLPASRSSPPMRSLVGASVMDRMVAGSQGHEPLPSRRVRPATGAWRSISVVTSCGSFGHAPAAGSSLTPMRTVTATASALSTRPMPAIP